MASLGPYFPWSPLTFPGNVAVAKTYLGEVTDETNQALGISLLSMTWGLGNILGTCYLTVVAILMHRIAPTMGGFLANVTLIPGDPLERAYPYLLVSPYMSP